MDPLIVLSIAAIWAAITIWLIVTLVMDRKHFQRIIDNRNREILEIAKEAVELRHEKALPQLEKAIKLEIAEDIRRWKKTKLTKRNPCPTCVHKQKTHTERINGVRLEPIYDRLLPPCLCGQHRQELTPKELASLIPYKRKSRSE